MMVFRFFAEKSYMRRFLFSLFCFAMIVHCDAQVNMKLGFTGGPTFSFAGSDSVLSDGFFTSTKTGFNVGSVLTLQAGEHFFSRLGVNYSNQGFALRQTSDAIYGTDVRFRLNQLEIPLSIGFTGYLGNLRHREYIGVGVRFPLSSYNNVILKTDTSVAHTITITQQPIKGLATFLLAGFEIGSEFKNDAAIFFGASFKYGMQNLMNGGLVSSHFAPQAVSYNGTYVGLELTYYLPRFSYWFKRDFTY